MTSNLKDFWQRWRQIIIALFFIIIAIVFASVFKIEELHKFLNAHPTLGILVTVLVYVLLGFTFIPSEPVTLLVLTWKGPFIAILLATIGNTLAGLVEFAIGGNIGDFSDFEKKKKKLPFHLDRLPITSPLFLLLGRMLPGFGPKFVSVISGVYRVPFFTYLWTTFAATLVGAIILSFGGYGIFSMIK